MKRHSPLLLTAVLLTHAQCTFSAVSNTNLPTGSWLFSTQIQLQVQPTVDAKIISNLPILGKEIGTYYPSDRSYFSTEWISKQNSCFTDANAQKTYCYPPQPILGQWTPNKSAFTMTFDPAALNVLNNSAQSAVTGFLLRSEYVDAIGKSLNTVPVIDNVRMLSYIDNGQVLSKGKKLKGKKQMAFLAQWHGEQLTKQQAFIQITENYSAVPYSLTSECCGDDKAKNATDSETFLKVVDTLPDIQKTDSGLRYWVLQEGKGVSPIATDKVLVNYRGFYPSGALFDNNNFISFSLSGVIKGWTEGLQLMKPGGKYRFFIPADLAYGSNGNASIKGNSALVFDVELLGVVAP